MFWGILNSGTKVKNKTKRPEISAIKERKDFSNLYALYAYLIDAKNNIKMLTNVKRRGLSEGKKKCKVANLKIFHLCEI